MNRLSVSWWNLRLRLVTLLAGGAEAVYKTLRYQAVRRFVYRPRPDDIFVVSYPKSGTTLVQMILFQLLTDGDLDRIPHIDAFSPWFEFDLDLDSGPFLESLPSPRVFKSHLPHRSTLPRQGRFIYLVRDVRDVALSAYHHLSLMSGREVELDLFVDSFLAGHPMFSGSWFRHLRSWWPHRDEPNVLFVSYDEMIGDLAGTVRRVAGFCGIAIPEAAMPRILERCGIAYMKAHDEVFDPRLHARVAMDRGSLGRGEPGAGRRDLSPRQRRRLAGSLAALARELGGAEPSRLLRPEAPEIEAEIDGEIGAELG